MHNGKQLCYVQYSLRKYLKDSFIEYQKMKLLMFRTGAMKW